MLTSISFIKAAEVSDACMSRRYQVFIFIHASYDYVQLFL